MIKKINLLVVVVLSLGIIYRLFLTSNGNFIFNMDNARDMVDVRNLVVLKKIKLTGPTSAINGLFNGPAWYYLLAIPFLLSGGNPYASIIMEIILWAIGGFFLLKLTSRFGRFATLVSGVLWVASDYIVLTNLYAFNPNPIVLLTPLFVYLLYQYIETGNLKFSILTFLLGGLFFNFEMNFGVFVIPVIIFSLILTKKISLIRSKNFWVGILFFAVCLLPQAFFDLRHNFLMIHAVINFLSTQHKTFNLITRLQNLTSGFYGVFSATMENHGILTLITLALFIPVTIRFIKIKEKNPIALICFSTIFTPYLLYVFTPVTVNPWHLGAEAAALIILIPFLMESLFNYNFWGKIIGLAIGVSIIIFSLLDIANFFTQDFGRVSGDPSRFSNEIHAIDFVYQYANGKNFKVYTYLPSVIDYPYQYLIWWEGRKKFGYLPIDYAYLPNRPAYIEDKTSFSATEADLAKRPKSNLVFLIKEPNLNYTRFGWEGELIKFKPLDKKMIGPLEVEVRTEQ